MAQTYNDSGAPDVSALYGESVKETIKNLWKAKKEYADHAMRSAEAAIEDLYRNYSIRYNINGPVFDSFRNYDEIESALYMDMNRYLSPAVQRDRMLEEERGKRQEYNGPSANGQYVSDFDQSSLGATINLMSGGINLGGARVTSVFTGEKREDDARPIRVKVIAQPAEAPRTKQVRNIIAHDFSKEDLIVEKREKSTVLNFPEMKNLTVEVPYYPDDDLKSALELLREMDRIGDRIARQEEVYKELLRGVARRNPKAMKEAARMFGLKENDAVAQMQHLQAGIDVYDEKKEEFARFSHNTNGTKRMLVKEIQKQASSLPHNQEMPPEPKKKRNNNIDR